MGVYEDGFAAGYAAGMRHAMEGITPESIVAPIVKKGAMRRARQKTTTRRKDPKMAKALKEANRRGRTKSGRLRKGYTQAKIMTMAHKIRRRM